MLAFVVADPQAGHDPTVIGILTIVSIDILIVASYHRDRSLFYVLLTVCFSTRGSLSLFRERDAHTLLTRDEI